MTGEIKRPLLRYHGGKWKLANWIIAQFPPHRTYVEPFGGGASVLLKKARSHAEIYNDLGGEIVNLFRVVRDRGEELIRLLELTPFARDEFNLSYSASNDQLEQARRTLVRSYFGFGSNFTKRTVAGPIMRTGFRANSNRSGSTPAQDWKNYPLHLPTVIERLRGVILENRHAIEVMTAHDSRESLFYVDPPYVAETRDRGGDYPVEMSDADHRALAAFLNQCSGAVVVSGYACDLYDKELFAGWERLEKPSLADGARPRLEVLWMRNIDRGLFQ